MLISAMNFRLAYLMFKNMSYFDIKKDIKITISV